MRPPQTQELPNPQAQALQILICSGNGLAGLYSIRVLREFSSVWSQTEPPPCLDNLCEKEIAHGDPRRNNVFRSFVNVQKLLAISFFVLALLRAANVDRVKEILEKLQYTEPLPMHLFFEKGLALEPSSRKERRGD